MLDPLHDERSLIPPEIQAVILAGAGTRMYPLTEDMPKALLPIANQPLISNPLSWLEGTGVNQVFIACYPESRQRVLMIV